MELVYLGLAIAGGVALAILFVAVVFAIHNKFEARAQIVEYQRTTLNRLEKNGYEMRESIRELESKAGRF